MRLNEEQRTAVAAEGNAYIQACPGSGKTRVLVAKALRDVNRVAATPRKIACITFTNAAVDEMQGRLGFLAAATEATSVDVGTIHSFCLQNIFKPFRCRTADYANGFEIVSAEEDRAKELFNEIAVRLGHGGASQRSFDALSQVAIDLQGGPVAERLDGWIRDCIVAYWVEFRRRGWIDFSLLLFESLQILRSHGEICASLSAKFKILLVDEFQDTTGIQLEIFSRIHSAGSTSFFLVGDPHQSIYRFAGASVEAAVKFVKSIGAACDYPLSGNFRSTARIVQVAERLLTREPPMQAVGEWAAAETDVTIQKTSSVPQAIVEQFVPAVHRLGLSLGSSAVLAAWWTDLLPIARQCYRSGIAVVGPGARPYRRGRLIVPLLENMAAVVSQAGALRSTQRALARSVNEIAGGDANHVVGWRGRLVALELHDAAREAAAIDPAPLRWIVDIGGRIDQILAVHQIVNTDAFLMSAREVVADIHIYAQRDRIDLNLMTIGNLGLFADPKNALKLLTVHTSKGREFDAVAIVHMNEGRFPHFMASTDAQIEDGRRAAYVGITRAKRVLHFYVETSDRRNAESRFVGECCG